MKPDIMNSRYNEVQRLVSAKILLYMNRNVSVKANSGYSEISVITSWFCYPQWAIMLLVMNQPLITNHIFGPCEKLKLNITKWVTFSSGTISQKWFFILSLAGVCTGT